MSAKYSKDKGLRVVDGYIKNWETNLESLDIITNNSNYSPEYLKSIYIVEFFAILKKVEKRIKRNNKK